MRGLLALHRAGMTADSPPGTVFALDLSGLRAPGVTVWTAWRGHDLAAIGAIKRLAEIHAEVKSMRTHPDHLRTGAGAAILDHIVATARREGIAKLSLETGRGAAFEPALAFYAAHGFVEGDAFASYPDNGFSRFFHRHLST